MTEHPLYSDKDNCIRNLEIRIKELEKLNSNLSRDNNKLSKDKSRKIRKAVWKFFKIFLVFIFVSSFVVGGGYWIQSCISNSNHLDKQCAKLCKMTIGNLATSGYQSTSATCRESENHCNCETVFETEVYLPRITYKELNGDLLKIAELFDTEFWKKCIYVKRQNLIYSQDRLDCLYIPWNQKKFDVEFVNARQKQNRVDRSNR